MFHLEATDAQNCQKIDIMDIWKISLTVTLNLQNNSFCCEMVQAMIESI